VINGGHCNINDLNSITMEFCVIILNPTEYFNLIRQSNEISNFPQLAKRIDGIVSTIHRECSVRTKWTLLVLDIEGEIAIQVFIYMIIYVCLYISVFCMYICVCMYMNIHIYIYSVFVYTLYICT
jgi:hypothetical protein